MKIALLSPRGPLYRHRTGIWRRSLRYAPLTLVTLAAYVPEELDADVSIHDEGVEDIPLDLDADVIGISCITGSSVRAYELADHYRKRGATVVLGGVHPTLMPEEAKEHADSVVVGYAEQTWPQLLRDYANNALKPYYRAKTSEVDMRNLPLPRRDLQVKSKYLFADVIEATRGCMHRCEFCVIETAWGNRPIQKPVGDVIAEIRAIGSKRLIFLDLNLIANVAYAKELFRAMIPLKLKWTGLSTVLITLDEELLDLCARSGCVGLLLGLESVSKEALTQTHKLFNTAVDYGQVIARLHERGISIMACFTFGLDGDDIGVFERTAEFCIKYSIDLPRFSIVTPFPNTPLYNRLESEGRILTKDWDLYDAQHVVFQPKNMTVEELYRGTEWAWKRVYEYGSIWKRLSKTKMNLPFVIPANIGYRFYANNLHRYYTCEAFEP